MAQGLLSPCHRLVWKAARALPLERPQFSLLERTGQGEDSAEAGGAGVRLWSSWTWSLTCSDNDGTEQSWAGQRKEEPGGHVH